MDRKKNTAAAARLLLMLAALCMVLSCARGNQSEAEERAPAVKAGKIEPGTGPDDAGPSVAGQKVRDSSETRENKEQSAETGAAVPTEDAPYRAARDSKVFHHRGCSYVERIDKDKLVGFADREEARRSGRRPCKVCKP